MDNVVCVKLTTNEEIVGILKKLYSEGDMRLSEVMIITTGPKGQYLEDFLMGGINSELEIRSHAIVTHSPANEALVDLFSRTLIHNEENAGKIDKVVN